MFWRNLLAAGITVALFGGLAWLLGAALSPDLLAAFAVGMGLMAIESALMTPGHAVESE